ncbi:MAG: ectoine hydroxylase-related dioxygenase (phytanoyl-CoA dioxygenase family) [Phenylobacterium sp.]|jgi:ectoine hydroxylase-related dioxygenase (phytanoyl-CoA dioxygenase family)
MIINTTRFTQFDSEAIEFYQRHGWVLISDAVSTDECQQMRQGWQQMVDTQATSIGCETQQYLQVICQWRDLWKQQKAFAKVLQNPLARLASQSFELPGCRLFHDKIICKSIEHCNGQIPWHQDSMYWPVDRTGMSTWTALQDVSAEQGCLEVADGSHQWGESEPVDFMYEQESLPQDGPTWLIPACEGDVVMLHSRTWHRSAASTVKGHSRIAHIGLWVPQQSRFWPQNASWHPVNAQVTVRPGQVFNDDEFPVFGEATGGTYKVDEQGMGNTVVNKHQGHSAKQGMFNAKKRVTTQIAQILQQSGTLGELLADATNRQKVMAAVLAGNNDADEAKVMAVVQSLWIGAAAYEQLRSRNVFSSGYKQWEILYGE